MLHHVVSLLFTNAQCIVSGIQPHCFTMTVFLISDTEFVIPCIEILQIFRVLTGCVANSQEQTCALPGSVGDICSPALSNGKELVFREAWKCHSPPNVPSKSSGLLWCVCVVGLGVCCIFNSI